MGSIPGPGRSPGEGNGNPLQYSCLENPTDPGAWQSIRVARVGHDLATKPPPPCCNLLSVQWHFVLKNVQTLILKYFSSKKKKS